MVSATQQTSRIRRHKARTAGKRRKREERAHGTPKFPIHPGQDGGGSTPQAAAKKES